MNFETTRRGFLEFLGASSMAMGGSTAQLDSFEGDDIADFDAYGMLLGPSKARPAAQGEYLAEYDTYRFVYFATDTGERSFINHTLSSWENMPSDIDLNTTQVGEVIVEDFKSQFNYTFNRPNAPSTLRWNATNVTADDPEVVLTGSASLSSTARGNYAPGSQSIPGIAFRVTDTPGVGESATGGYYTPDDGMLVGEDENGPYAEVRDSGVPVEVRLDGNENNGTLPPNFTGFQDHTRIVRFPHLFYRGGAIGVDILGYDGDTPKLYRAHTFTPQNVDAATGTPISQPNLPVAFDSNSLTPELRVSAAHYEKGEDEAEGRLNGEFVNTSGIDDADWHHLISWRKRSGYDSVRVEPLNISTIPASSDVKLAILLDSTLDLGTSTFDTPGQTSSSETAVEVVTDASITTDGERRWVDTASAGQGNKSGAAASSELDFNLPTGQVVTLAAQSFTTTDASVRGAINWEEYF